MMKPGMGEDGCAIGMTPVVGLQGSACRSSACVPFPIAHSSRP